MWCYGNSVVMSDDHRPVCFKVVVHLGVQTEELPVTRKKSKKVQASTVMRSFGEYGIHAYWKIYWSKLCRCLYWISSIPFPLLQLYIDLFPCPGMVFKPEVKDVAVQCELLVPVPIQHQWCSSPVHPASSCGENIPDCLDRTWDVSQLDDADESL